MRFLKLTATSLGSNNRAVLAQGVSDGATGDDSNAEPAGADVEVIHPLGLVARPTITDNTELVAIQDGDEFIGLGIVDKSMTTLGDSDCAAGELLLFCPAVPASRLKWDSSGNFTVTAGNAVLTVNKNGDAIVNANGTKLTLHNNGNIEINAGSNEVIFNGGSTPVAKEGSQTTGHYHSGSGMTAGPYPVAGNTMTNTDTVASGQGSANILVP